MESQAGTSQMGLRRGFPQGSQNLWSQPVQETEQVSKMMTSNGTTGTISLTEGEHYCTHFNNLAWVTLSDEVISVFNTKTQVFASFTGRTKMEASWFTLFSPLHLWKSFALSNGMVCTSSGPTVNKLHHLLLLPFLAQKQHFCVPTKLYYVRESIFPSIKLFTCGCGLDQSASHEEGTIGRLQRQWHLRCQHINWHGVSYIPRGQSKGRLYRKDALSFVFTGFGFLDRAWLTGGSSNQLTSNFSKFLPVSKLFPIKLCKMVLCNKPSGMLVNFF